MSNSQQPAPQPRPVAHSQRELVGLALHRGARLPAGAPAVNPQRDRVRLALALGIGRPRGRRR